MTFAELVLRAFLALAVIILPGFAFAWRFLPNIVKREKVILSIAIGVGTAIYAGYLLTQIHFYATILFFLGGTIVAAIYLIMLAVRAKPTLSTDWLKSSGWLFAIVLGATALRLYPVLCSEYPSGTDTVFHLILARKIVLFGHLPTDWMPFENIAVNYTLGGHLLVALVSEIAGIPLHLAFTLVMVALQGISIALVYVVGKVIFKREGIALAAAVAYGFVALDGSLDYYRWGGLPTLTGMTMLVASLALIFWDRKRASLFFASFVLAALYIAHHHSMLVAFVVYGVCIAALWIRGNRDLARRFFFGVVGSIVLAAFWLVPYALRAGKLGDTLVGGFWIFFIRPWEIPTEVGLIYSILIVPGLIGLFVVWRKSREENLLAWGAWTAALFGAFVAGEYGFRAMTKLITGTALVVFTPAHFLNDAAYPFAFAAGWTLERGAEWLSRFGKRSKLIVTATAVVLLIGVGAATMRTQCWVVIKPDEMAMYDWIQTRTAPHALFLENPYWLNFVTWREGSLTPLPVTEPVTSPSVVYKQEVLGKRNWDEIAKWQKETGRPVYLVTRNETLARIGWSQVFGEGQWRVYQFGNE